MAHIDNSLAMTVPTSESFAGNTVIIDTDDRTSLTGLDRMEIIICFAILIFFLNEILPTAPPDWHTLNSFHPIFELLGPKFVLDQNAYVSSYYLSTLITLRNSDSFNQYIHGLVDDNDLEILRSYSSLVTEFILADDENDKPIIAQPTFLCIAELLERNSGLLPSLSRLRIIQADSYFPYLHLLHTPSLRTLEANVPDQQHPSFFSFLTTLVHKAPLLEEIILGPGQFPLKSLQTILRFTHLRQLELRDVASTMDFTFLQGVGTLLNLESFILDVRSCTYTARIPDERPSKTPPARHTEVESQMSGPSSDVDSNEDTTRVESETLKLFSDIDNDGFLISYPSSPPPISPAIGINEDKEVDQPLPPIYDQIPCNNSSSISAVGGFHQLKKFHFVGELPLLQDMILYIASSTLEDISITFFHLFPHDLRPELEAEKMSQAKRRQEFDQKTQLEIEAMEKATTTAYNNTNKRYKHYSLSRNLSSKRQEILDKAETRWKEQEAQYQVQYKERKEAEWIQKRRSILQTVSSRWSADLKTVKLNNLDRSDTLLPTLPVLPKLVYEPLFCHPKLEILEFKQWKIDSVKDFLLSMKSSGPKNLKQLRLPIADPGSAISISGLLDIAEACPKLEYLHCCIDTLPPIPEYSVPANNALSHGLQSLSVANNPTSHWDFNQLLLAARHLYLTFPGLQSIEGPSAEQWVRIPKLVKMFQVIRQDDVYRFQY